MVFFMDIQLTGREGGVKITAPSPWLNSETLNQMKWNFTQT